MLYSGVSWAMDLLTQFLHYTSLIIFFIHLLSLLSCFFLHLEWYFFTFQCMKDSCIMDIVLGSLVEKVILSILVFESVFISLCILNGAHFFYIQSMHREKKEKRKAYVCMYTMSFSIECVYWLLRVVFLSQLLMKVHMWAFKCSSLFMPISLCILCVRDEWPFPKDFRSLSSLSLHTLVIWLFSMTWFKRISAHLSSFYLFILLMVSHSSCLHCSLFISIYILCSIFSTHHFYTFHR